MNSTTVETKDAIRVKGGYVYIDLKTGKVKGHEQVEIRRAVLESGLAGYNKDGTIIFIDKIISPKDVAPLVAHEAIESVLILDYGYSYPRAHRTARRYEKRFVEAHKGHWKDYSDRLLSHILEIYQRKGVKEPKELYPGMLLHAPASYRKSADLERSFLRLLPCSIRKLYFRYFF